MKGIGILLNPETGDLQVNTSRDAMDLISQGLEVGNATYQNQAIILQANKGEFKEMPMLGVGISGMTNDHQTTSWVREIVMQLSDEGMRVRDINIDIINGKLTIDADYSS